MSNKKITDISVIVITHNRAMLVKETINSIKKAESNYQGKIEKIVINSSNEKYFENDSSIKEMYAPTLKRASSKRNLGLFNALHAWLLFVDDDCIICENTFSILSRYVMKVSPDVVGFYGITRFSDKKSFALKCAENSEFTYSFEAAKSGGNMPWGPTSIALFRKSLLQKINGFDENFSVPAGGEDVDIGMRINMRGWKLRGIPKVIAFHSSKTWNNYYLNLKRCFRYGISDIELLIRHPRWSYLKLNSLLLLLFPMIVQIIVTLLFFTFYPFVFFSMIMVYITIISLLSAHYNKIEYKKSGLEALGLLCYERAYELGAIYSALRTRCTKGLFFRSYFQLEENSVSARILGRDRFLYKKEKFELLGIILGLIVNFFIVRLFYNIN